MSFRSNNASMSHSIQLLSYIDKWNAAIGFEQKPMLGKVILHLLVDNFFLQVNHDNLTYQWFHDYMDRLKTVISQVQITS